MVCTDWDGKSRVHNFLHDPLQLTLLQKRDSIRKSSSIIFNFVVTSLHHYFLGIGSSTSALRFSSSEGKQYFPMQHQRPQQNHRRRKPRGCFVLFSGRDMFDNKLSILHDAEVEAYKMIVDEGKAKMEEDLLPDMENRRNMISKTLKKLNEGLVERVEETQLLLLAALCREHLLLLGPPGTGVTISVTS